MSQWGGKSTVAFKTRVALDALSGEHTLSELAGKYGVHPHQVSQWGNSRPGNRLRQALPAGPRRPGRAMKSG